MGSSDWSWDADIHVSIDVIKSYVSLDGKRAGRVRPVPEVVDTGGERIRDTVNEIVSRKVERKQSM
jgi:hypothetical protein